MNPFIVTLILSIIAEAIKDYERLFKVKPFYYKGWVLIAALTVSAYYANKNNVDNDTKIALLDTTNSKLTKKVDSFRTSFDSGIKDVANDMSFNFGQTAKHGDTNTISILADALSNRKELHYTIDSLTKRLESISGKKDAFVTFIPDATSGLNVNFTRDSIIAHGAIANTGDKAAYGVVDSVYFMWKINDTIFKLPSPIHIDWPQDWDGQVQGGFEFKYPLDPASSANSANIVSIYFAYFGHYYLESEHKNIKRINIGLQYNPKIKQYSIFNSRVGLREMFNHAFPIY